MDEVDPSSGESLPRAFERTSSWTKRAASFRNTVSQFLSLLFRVHLFSRGWYFPPPLLCLSLSLAWFLNVRYMIFLRSFVSPGLSIIFVSLWTRCDIFFLSFFFEGEGLIMELTCITIPFSVFEWWKVYCSGSRLCYKRVWNASNRAISDFAAFLKG